MKLGVTPGLSNLAFAGFREWARQWVLLNHNQPRHAGRMYLKMAVGGSDGHGGTYAVEVDEGRPQDPLSGRRWDVKVEDLEAEEDEADAAEVDSDKGPTMVDRALDLLNDEPEGLTHRSLRTGLGASGSVVSQVVAELLRDGRVSEMSVKQDGQTVQVLVANNALV